MAIDNDTSYELTGAQIKDLAQKIRNKADDDVFVGAGTSVAGSRGLVPAPAAGDNTKFLKGDGTWQALTNLFYPVGSIYMSATLATAADVEAALGGTWVAWGAGRVPVGVDASDTDFDTAEETGGSKTHSHPLGNNGAAGIRNVAGTTYCVAGATGVNDLSHMDGTSNSVFAWTHNRDSSTTTDQTGVRLYGNTETETTIPPYITCYMYKRTA